MKYKKLGASDLRLSVIGLGCWSFGGGDYWGEQSQNDVNEVVRSALDSGINYFDTAEAYNEGRSESSLGMAIQGLNRENIVVGTKITPANCYPGLIEKHCEDSLRRLQTDYIDLYMIHWPIHPHSIRHSTNDPAIIANPPDIARTFETLLKLQENGKIRHIGISNFSRNRMKNDIPPSLKVAANQLPYNLLCRAIEFDTMPWCEQNGIGIIGYMTLLQGVLSGIYSTLADVPEWRRRTRHFSSQSTPKCRHGEPGFEQDTENAIKAIKRIAQANDIPMTDIATRWSVENTNISCALVGVRNIAQLKANLKAVQTPLDPDIVQQLNQATEHLKLQMGNHFDYYESAENDRTL
jgi:aryl-alcohol dehydrogenase-like predicted oxidoreductase